MTKRRVQFFLLTLVGVLMAPVLGWATSIELISVNRSTSATPDRTYSNPRLNKNGRYIVYESRLLNGSKSRVRPREITLYDRHKRSWRKLDAPSLTRSNSGPTISESGRVIAFQSYLSTAVPEEPPLVSDIVLYDRFLNHSVFQNFGPGEHSLDGENLDPTLSGDGRLLVFTSNATIYPGSQNGVTRQVYLYDFERHALELVSQSTTGVVGNRPSGDPHVNESGDLVTFKSESTNLLNLYPIESLTPHLYLFNRTSGELIQIDETERGFDTDELIAGRVAMDGPGQRIVFEGRHRKTTEPAFSLYATDLFLFDRSSGVVTQLTEGLFAARSHSPSLSGDGHYLVFVFRGLSRGKEKVAGGLILYDMERRDWIKLMEGACYNPQISKDGRWIVFESDEKDLVPGASPKIMNIYLLPNPVLE